MDNRKKDILFVLNTFSKGGVEKAFIDLSSELINTGRYNIYLIVLSTAQESLIDINKKIRVLNINSDILKKFDSIRMKVKEKKIKYYIELMIDIVKSYNIKLKNRMSFGESIRYFYINKIDIIPLKFDVAISFSDGFSLDFILKKIDALKKITFIHVDYEKKKFFPKNIYLNYVKVDNVFCVSKKACDDFLKIYPQFRYKTFNVNNIFNTEYIKLKKDEGLNEFDLNSINLLMVGRLSKEKNQILSIKSFLSAYERFNVNAKLYIIGDGPEREHLYKFVKKNNAIDKIIFLGKKDNPYSYMNKCDIFIQSSSNEGFGLTILEALYLKKPIITTDVGIVSQYIINNYNGYIVKSQDEFSDIIVDLVNNKVKREKIVNNINFNYSNNETINFLNDFFEKECNK